MTVTIQTPWTYELFNEAMLTFERSLSRTVHVRCAHDTTTMLENIATWAKSRGHSVLTIDEARMIITIRKKPMKTTGGYQPKGPSKLTELPTSGSNAVKHTIYTYEDLAANIHELSPDQERELISLYRNYVERMENSWNARYTYCTGCRKTVRRDNTYTELTPDGRLLIKCKSCDMLWYVK